MKFSIKCFEKVRFYLIVWQERCIIFIATARGSFLRNENICKFISGAATNGLDITSFVLEAQADTLRMPQTLNKHSLFLVTQGEGTFTFSGQVVPVSTGSLVFGFHGEEFSVKTLPSPCKYMYIRFAGIRADELFRRFNISPAARSFSGFDGLIPMWSESLSRADEQTIDLAAESMLLYTFSRLSGNITEHNSLISSIVAISEAQFTDPTLSVSEISRMLGYNSKYISHVFKKKMGVGYSEYLKSLRIKYAVTLFDHGIESVKNVALLSGFSDPLYFSTTFKNSVGVSPKEYRARKQTDE